MEQINHSLRDNPLRIARSTRLILGPIQVFPHFQTLPALGSSIGLSQGAPNHKLYIMTPNSQNYLKDFRFWFIIASFIILWVMILRAYPLG